MYGLKTRYLASVFVDAEDITPSNRVISDLMGVIADDDLTPDLQQELTPLGVQQRIGFRSLDGATVLALNRQRFDFARTITRIDGAEGDDLGSFDSFVGKRYPSLLR